MESVMEDACTDGVSEEGKTSIAFPNSDFNIAFHNLLRQF